MVSACPGRSPVTGLCNGRPSSLAVPSIKKSVQVQVHNPSSPAGHNHLCAHKVVTLPASHPSFRIWLLTHQRSFSHLAATWPTSLTDHGSTYYCKTRSSNPFTQRCPKGPVDQPWSTLAQHLSPQHSASFLESKAAASQPLRYARSQLVPPSLSSLRPVTHLFTFRTTLLLVTTVPQPPSNAVHVPRSLIPTNSVCAPHVRGRRQLRPAKSANSTGLPFRPDPSTGVRRQSADPQHYTHWIWPHQSKSEFSRRRCNSTFPHSHPPCLSPCAARGASALS